MKVHLAISNTITRQGLKSILLKFNPALEFFEIKTSFELLQIIEKQAGDVFLIDLLDNGTFDWEDIKRIRTSIASIKCILFAKSYTKDQILLLKEIANLGLLYLDSDEKVILQAMESVTTEKIL